MYLVIHFTVKISKKSLGQIQSYEHATFLGLKWPIYPK